MFVGVFYVDTGEAASSTTDCADSQRSPQERPQATGERLNPLQDNDRVSLTQKLKIYNNITTVHRFIALALCTKWRIWSTL